MSEGEHVDAAMNALDSALHQIDEVGSLRQDEFRFIFFLVTALVHALLQIAAREEELE